MTYNTPELQLVGSAQNLVLGNNPKEVVGNNYDLDFIGYTTVPGITEDSW